MSSNSAVLGIDTSNYTTSAAYFDVLNNELRQAKRLLPVKPGEKGIRQSDAVFHHTVQLPDMLEQLGDISDICAVGVSDRPSCRESSYMPCFLTGVAAARVIGAARSVPYYTASHQTGHILAALYSAGRLDWMRGGERFIAFHVSGGTTDMLLCECGGEELIKIERIGGSADLKAGQAIDRCGVMLGLDFPCGAELEKLACGYSEVIKIKPSVKGTECSLSGIENQCRGLFDAGADKGYIAAYCLTAVGAAILAVTDAAIREYGDLPLIYAGGVMSDRLIKDMIQSAHQADFAEPQFSCDNAAGMAIYAAFMKGLI